MKATSNISDNRQAFEQFYAEYFKVIRAYIAYRILHKYEAEDLAQDVFVRLLEYGQLINRTTISSFLFTIARNLVNDVLRRHCCREEVMAEWERNVSRSTNSTEQESDARELSFLYKMQILRLPPQRRQVYELVDCKDWSINKVAAHMNLSVRTVGNHLYIARNEIRTRLSRILQAG